MFDIVTSICVDEGKEDNKSFYPLMGGLNADQRRLLYWQLVVIYCATAKRIYPERRIVVYTNDKKPAISGTLNLNELLASWGVEVIDLPFKKYKYPPGFGDLFLNAFYKLDVIAELAKGPKDRCSLLLDSDCMWVRKTPELDTMINSGKLVIYDIYHRKPEDNQPHNLSAYDLADAYRKIDPDYPNPIPIRFGGEAMGGSAETFKKVDDVLSFGFNAAVDYHKANGHPVKMASGQSILDGMEHISNFAFNKVEVPIADIHPYLQRIWDVPHYNNVTPETFNKTIWHMPSEKKRGFKLIYPLVIDETSEFWTTDVEKLPELLGGYVGVPERLYFVKEQKPTLLSRAKSKIAQMLR